MSAQIPDPDDDVALAGEYALGLLNPAERRDVEMRLGGEPALRRLVAEWLEGLVTLTDPIQPVEPPADLRRRIEESIFTETPLRTRPGIPVLGALMGMLVGVLAVLVVMFAAPLLLPPTAPAGPVYTATIATTDNSLTVLARFDPATGVLTADRTKGAPAPGRSLELWVIPAGATTPVSLGVIDTARSEITVPPALVPGVTGGTLAVSDEPAGGSVTGSPTTVLATAPVTLL